MKNGIPKEQYYELLEWKDTHREEFQAIHGSHSLNDLSTNELQNLYVTMLNSEKYEVGDKVHYIRDNADISTAENGMVKNFGSEPGKYFVVYNCGGEWENYQNYTAALTDKRNLRKGWI